MVCHGSLGNGVLGKIHNLPIGFTTEGMARQFGDFIGNFLEYDASLLMRRVSQYMRIRVIIDT